MKNSILIALLILVGGCHRKTAMVVSDRDGWHKIGETYVDFTKEREEIVLKGSNRFAKLQLVVFDASIELQDMEVYYEDGKKQDIALRTQMTEDKKSRVIDVMGKESSITKVVFVYKTIPNKEKEKGMLQIWGYKSNVVDTKDEKAKDKSDADNKNPATGEAPKTAVVVAEKSGWIQIASTIVDFAKDSDEVKVLGKDHFSQVKLKAKDAAILLDAVIVYYEGDNTFQRIKIPILLKEGEETKNLALEGGKSIYKMVFVYKTVPNQDKEKAEIEIWGLK